MMAKRTEILNVIANREKETRIFFIIFYAVGIIGLSIPLTFIFFTKLVPFALILSFIALALFHSDKENKMSIIVYVGIFLIGFVIEAIGVNTGLIFGNYQYGDSLGIKLFQTPIIIGLNWLFLVYTTASVIEKFGFHNIFKILLGSTIMLIYDIALEQIAPKIDMWDWSDEIVPVQNYLAWFLIALVFHSMLKVLRIKTQNPLSLFILACQFLFFICLLFLLN